VESGSSETVSKVDSHNTRGIFHELCEVAVGVRKVAVGGGRSSGNLGALLLLSEWRKTIELVVEGAVDNNSMRPWTGR
jgi:hypothetical protein